jgi:L-amino acid N-acyltransferase YncA
MIRSVETGDAAQLCDIYNFYVKNSFSTFEEKPITVDSMKQRINEVIIHFPWIVYEQHDRIVAYAYANRWRQRPAYRKSVEVTVYVETDMQGQQIASQLYQQLIQLLRGEGFHSAIGGISLPNPASIALHEKLGFTKVAEFKEVGLKFEQRVDVGYWQLIL